MRTSIKIFSSRGLWLLCAVMFCVLGVLQLTQAGGAETYVDLNATTGLTIRAVDTSQCTSFPNPQPDVSHTDYYFVEKGSGTYYRFLAKGWYHFFSGTSSLTWIGIRYVTGDTLQAQLDVINANNWVTNARMADNAIGSAEISNESITSSDIQTAAVGASEIVDGGVDWAELNAAVKGSSPDVNYDIDEMQTDVVAMKGAWTGSDDDLKECSDKIRYVYKTTDFDCTPATDCSTRVLATGLERGIGISFSMNSTRNDTCVFGYEVHISPTQYAGTVGGVLSSAQYQALNNAMPTYQRMERIQYGSSIFIPTAGRLYVVVTAHSYAGTILASVQVNAEATDIDVGSVSSLVGQPGYTAGMDLTDVVGNLLQQMALLQEQAAVISTTSGRIVVYADHITSYSSAVSTTAAVYSAMTGGPPARRILSSYKRFFGYSKLHLTCQAKMRTASTSGYIYFNGDGSGNPTPQLFGAGASDVNWTVIDHIYDFSASVAVDSVAQWGLGIVANDTMYIRYPVVYLEP